MNPSITLGAQYSMRCLMFLAVSRLSDVDFVYSTSRVTIPSGVLTMVSLDISVTLYEWMLRRGVGVNRSSSLVELPSRKPSLNKGSYIITRIAH